MHLIPSHCMKAADMSLQTEEAEVISKPNWENLRIVCIGREPTEN